MAEVPEKSLERYDVLDRIAVGGMAEVFLAKAYGAHGFEKTLAIKRILPELARDPEFEERFIAEAKVAVKLSHANVVQVFDFGRFAGSLFIAMEYVDGLDLAALLRRFKERNERIPLAAAFQIAIELVRGLDFAHSHGVVHRDVSPSNILLSRAGEVKIADFGIAVAAHPGKISPTGRRKVMGKWRYMSPEQARGEPLDTRSDLFSAAAVIYELFTGEKMFPGDEAEDIIRNIEEMPLPRPSTVRRGIPPRLDAILHHALARRPGDRPPRPAVMLRALTELTYESSIVATPLDVAEAVSYVVDLSTPTGNRLDDILRAQLHQFAEPSQVRQTARGDRRTEDYGARPPASIDGDEVDRLTAVTIAQRRRPPVGLLVASVDPDSGLHRLDRLDESRPVLRQSIDSDGISRLELDLTTISGAPWELPGEPPAMPEPASAAGRTVPADRPGGPPAAAPNRPRPRASEPATETEVPRRRSRIAVASVGVVVAGAITTAVVAFRGPPAAPTPPTSPDAAPTLVAPPPLATLVIETVPVGARGTAGAHTFGPTPATLQVPPGTISVRIELPGHEPYVEDHLVVAAGQTLRLRATLAPAQARLVLVTDPPGARVILDGVALGATPLTADRLMPRTGARLSVSKPGFATQAFSIELPAGRETRVERTLRAAPPQMGEISLSVVDAKGPLWGDVYLRGKKVGQAPDRALQLPVGRHRLRVTNAPTGRSTTIDVDVVPGQPRVYTARLP